MKVWAETKGGLLLNASVASALDGFKGKRYEYDLFPTTMTEDLFPTIDPAKNILIGSIQSLRRYFDIHSIPQPPNLDYPEELKKFLGRSIAAVSFSFFKENFEKFKHCFLKPVEHKLFNGFVFYRMHQLLKLSHLSNSDMIWISDEISILSEFRVYVFNKKIMSISSYAGCPEFLPDLSIVLEMIEDYKTQPVAYALDVCVDINGRTLLIEVNDSFALGSYAIQPWIHAEMVENRWRQITECKQKT